MPWEEADEKVGEVGTEGTAGGTKNGTSPMPPYICGLGLAGGT